MRIRMVMEFLIMWMYVWISLEILVMVVQNIIIRVVGFILVVEMVW
jgi:hypothetical protein